MIQGGVMTDSDISMKQPSGDNGWRDVMQPALGPSMYHLLASINMQDAWKKVKANNGAPGIDGITIQGYPAWINEHWPRIQKELQEGSYKPSPVLRCTIPKPNGGKRLLGIPTVMDRVIQQALLQILTPVFEPVFSEFSFGFRPGRSAHDAVRQMQQYVKEGYRIVVDLDIRKFFDEVDHDILMSLVARRVKEKPILKLIGRYLRAGVAVSESEIRPTFVGTPQGGPLSPLLANILLDVLDKELERRGHRFVRYADDVVILVKSQRAGERVLESIKRFLYKRLKLSLNDKKSRVVPCDKSKFLGFSFRGTKIVWHESSYEYFKFRIRQLTGRSWGVSMGYRLKKLNEFLRGWMNYYGLSEYYRPIPGIDQWIRRRLRMCFWKQWRKPRTRIQNLLKLGASKLHAIKTGLSSKGYWHLSRTLATQSGMTNEWFKELGLVSVRDIWIKVQGYDNTAPAPS